MIGYTLILAAVIGSCIAAIMAETVMGKAGFGYLSIMCLCLLILSRGRK